MSTKWKYASLPASERLEMVKSGNKDVYENEIARSLDVINSRKALGLDISEQKSWIDSVGYNYNLYNANRMGISQGRVNDKGYADRILGEFTPTVTVKTSSRRKSDSDYYAKKYLDEFYTKVSEAKEKRANVEEWLLNNGIDKNSEVGKMYLDEFEDELEELTEKYRKEYVSKVKAVLK